MATTYEKIATTTLGSAASTITFSSISSAYTDLRLVLTGSFTTADRTTITFNSDTATNYSFTRLWGDGSGANSGRQTSYGNIYVGATSRTVMTLATVDIFSYAGSTFKTALITQASDNNGSGDVWNAVGLWRSTSAISSIQLGSLGSNTYATGTTATLYGILKA
jgi:hypothetical protein